MSGISAVIFDLDGLIVDSETLGAKVWRRLCEEQGFNLAPEVYEKAVGKGLEQLLAIFAAEFGPQFFPLRIRERRPIVWQEMLDTEGLPVKAGFHELLAFLEERGIRRAIATSTERTLVERRFRAAKLEASRFEVIVTGDEVPRVKPAPDIYIRAAGLLGVPPADCLALEDSETGAESAYRAGIPVIVVPDLSPPGEETRRKALEIKSNLLSVLAWIREKECL